MQLPRRSFIKTGALTAMTAGVALSGAHAAFSQRPAGPRTPAIPRAAEADPVFGLTLETFRPYVGDYFEAGSAHGELISLKLESARPYNTKAGTRLSTRMSPELRSFSLTFSSYERLPQFTSIHKLSHPALGGFDLFLTGNQLKDGSYVYEAVFSKF